MRIIKLEMRIIIFRMVELFILNLQKISNKKRKFTAYQKKKKDSKKKKKQFFFF